MTESEAEKYHLRIALGAIFGMPIWLFLAGLHEYFHIFGIPHAQCWKLEAKRAAHPTPEESKPTKGKE